MSHPERPGRRSSHEQRTTHRKSSRRSRPADIEPGTPFGGRDSNSPSHSFATTVPTRSNATADDVPLSPVSPDLERAGLSDHHMSRKRSLIRPERNRIGKDHPNYYYRQHAANMQTLPSRTGAEPLYEELDGPTQMDGTSREDAATGSIESKEKKRHSGDKDGGRHHKDRRSRRRANSRKQTGKISKKRRHKEVEHIRPPSLWDIYCAIITFWCPNFVLSCFGIKSKAQARAWREKMGLLSIIAAIMAIVGFLTFGFTRTVCGSPSTRLQINHVGNGYMIFNGQAYDLTGSHHPVAEGIPALTTGLGANVLYDLPEKMGGRDGSFLFQQVNGKCKDLITLADGSDVPTNDNGDLAWYFPCNTFAQDGSSKPNLTIPYYLGYACHTTAKSRNTFYTEVKPSADVYFTWDDISNSSRNLAVFSGSVLDLNLLNWFNASQVSVPNRWSQFADTSTPENKAIRGRDATHTLMKSGDKATAECFEQIIKVGSVDSESVGCIASKVVLYLSLVLILSVVVVRFSLAIMFQWFISRKYAASKTSQSSDKKKRNQQIEEWTEDIYRAPARLPGDIGSSVAGASSSDRTSKRASTFLPTTSRFSTVYGVDKPNMPTTMAGQSTGAALLHPNSQYAGANGGRNSYIGVDSYGPQPSPDGPGPAGFIHEAVVPQPPSDWMPFDYPLAHTLCLITAYSEGEMGIRTTIDSIAMTDYPNSHKCIIVICDGIIKGQGETKSTPDYVLGMMKDFTIIPEDVEAFSYVAVASGSKRHNMAKVYSGFYDYGAKSRIPTEKQQRVPMMLVVKCGTPAEEKKSKPGNRGKRDSQIILMSFLQKVMFDERMTELEYEMFNGMWKVTGISPDFYEVVLMVDADTKVFPDSLTHMVSAMVKDPEIMGLCGETKIANKRDSWVTAIQVFEYFISHHQAKSFESVFGGVTCLPGCFCMYRIKAPKGGNNYWVPILANPDVVEHYSENVVDTLHKKNLLLLGEDRYLSTLMLRTFPKRKQVFVPQAVCKTTVPDEFMILLSQRRRWINSTIHNLMELVLVRDLCGTFCFSMQFVVFIELMGTLVLPAAIAFTFYVGKCTMTTDTHSRPFR